jgi:hypothetical protein
VESPEMKLKKWQSSGRICASRYIYNYAKGLLWQQNSLLRKIVKNMTDQIRRRKRIT